MTRMALQLDLVFNWVMFLGALSCNFMRWIQTVSSAAF